MLFTWGGQHLQTNGNLDKTQTCAAITAEMI